MNFLKTTTILQFFIQPVYEKPLGIALGFRVFTVAEPMV